MLGLRDLDAEVHRLMSAVFDGTSVEISRVSSVHRAGADSVGITVQFEANGEFGQTGTVAPTPAGPIDMAWTLANYVQDEAVENALWAQPVPPCGVHDHHPANIEYEGPAGLRLECPYGDWSREIR
ncbi:hypothetical protein CZ771_13650 [Actinomycetales bacterium JB111]|nr:hypothetical protein CZ771_13650 [Actinomycetales bacterium JB111]